MAIRPYWRVFWALGLVWAVGCNGSLPSSSDTIPVHGKVFYRGRPLPTGTVVFTPDTDRGTNGELATGEIQPDGSFQLKTKAIAGTVVGWHRVTILAVEMMAPSPGQPLGEPRAILPPRYSDPRLSGLLCEVKAGRDNVINFNLE